MVKSRCSNRLDDVVDVVALLVLVEFVIRHPFLHR